MRQKAFNICEKLQGHGYEAVFAGGCVRDMILGIEPNDYDVATSATPKQVKEIFRNSKFVGESFGVSLIGDVEVATFRTEGSYSDGRRPDKVEFSTMEEDAKRRDLTINAMFFDPITENYIDFVSINGFKDMDNKIIRFVGNAEDRINEDNLRIMRAIRFANKFNFTVEDLTYKAIYKNAHKVSTLSGERILEELIKGMKKDAAAYIQFLKYFDVLKYILPEVHILDESEQDPIWHPEGAYVQEILYD